MMEVKAGDLIKENISGTIFEVSSVLPGMGCVYAQNTEFEYVQRLEFTDFKLAKGAESE
jgi:hypothetical protein